ncbi:MAG: DUF5723 family protein [Balneolaceae bacterium]
MGNFSQLSITLFSILIYFSGGLVSLQAQIILSPENGALGGGGTAYITGYEALFVNPANLFIKEKPGRIEIGLAGFGALTEPVLRASGLQNQSNNFQDMFSPFKPSVAHQDIFTAERLDIISRNFPGERLRSQHLFRFETYWLGVKWNTPNRSYALALRTRAGGRFVTGRGFYSGEPVIKNELQVIDRSIVSQFQTLHELSFGFAESFTFLNGLSPRLSEVIIGIAPKFVVGGSFQSVKYTNVFTRAESGPWDRTLGYEQLTTGDFTDATNSFLATGDPQAAINQNMNFSDFFSPTGFGAGLDFGLTFLLPLGEDISTIQRLETETRKSLRISFSVTDIGFISYTDRAQKNTIDEREEIANELEPLANSVFRGIPGQFLPFLNESSEHPLFESESNDDNFSTILPTAMHTGVLLQLNRLKVMGDLSLGITNNAINTTKLITFIGAELRPFRFLPVRAGTRLATETPEYYSFGFGIETNRFELNTSIQLRTRSGGPTGELAGLSVGSLKIYLP